MRTTELIKHFEGYMRSVVKDAVTEYVSTPAKERATEEKPRYELTDESKKVCGHTVYRIRALKKFRSESCYAWVYVGDLGGWVESEANLSQEGT